MGCGAVTLGLAALLKSSTVAYYTLRYVGAAYLLLLMAWRTLRGSSKAESLDEAEDSSPARRVFGQAAFLPQFVRPSAGRPVLQLLVLSGLHGGRPDRGFSGGIAARVALCGDLILRLPANRQPGW